MKDKIKVYIDKAKEFWSKFSGRTRKIIIAGTLGVIIFSVAAALILNNKDYEVLFTGLNDQEASEIIGKLQESKIDYKFENGGTILVPAEQEQKLKAQLVYEGYPKSGFTYNVFKDNIDLMTTDFEKNNYKLFELQDRIGSTITLFDGVKDAKVTIALGEDRKYVLDSKNITETTASVVVIMKDGGSPTPEQVKAIQRLVAKSIPELAMENVVVIDGEGNDVSVTPNLQTELNQLRAEFEKQLENSVKAKVTNVLIPFYGEENVKVSVKAKIDMNKKIRETINYFQPDVNDGVQNQNAGVADPNAAGQDDQAQTNEIKRGIPSKESINQEVVRDKNATGGVPGTETNADIPIYGNIELNGNETQIINQNDIDYLVDQIKEQTQIDAGMIDDLTVSVSINNKGNADTVSNDDLLKLVGNSAGIDPQKRVDKISIVKGEFFDPNEGVTEEKTFDKKQILIIAAVAIALLIALIATLLIFLRMKKKKAKLKAVQIPKEESLVEIPEELVKLMEADKDDAKDNLINIKNEKSLELRTNIREFAEQNPEISAQLLKSWLKGDRSDE
ncbi:MAG: flagellar basal-body MS-ring/collar protein FliF [Proteocatella sp.]